MNARDQNYCTRNEDYLGWTQEEIGHRCRISEPESVTTETLKTEKAKRLKTRQNLADLRDTRKGTSRTPKRRRRESERPCPPGETPFGQGDHPHPRSALLGAGCILWEVMASTCARDTGRHFPPPGVPPSGCGFRAARLH